MTEAVSIRLILTTTCFSITFCHICIFLISSRNLVFWYSSVLPPTASYMLWMFIFNFTYSVEDGIPDGISFQVSIPKHHLLPKITKCYWRHYIFLLPPTWLKSRTYLSVAYICQFENPRLPLKYPFIHLKIFSRVLQSLGGEELLRLTWWLVCSHESSIESAHAGHFHPSA